MGKFTRFAAGGVCAVSCIAGYNTFSDFQAIDQSFEECIEQQDGNQCSEVSKNEQGVGLPGSLFATFGWVALAGTSVYIGFKD